MKAFVRWSAALGLAGSVMMSTLLTGVMSALALTDQQVAERLRTVPVFTITNGDGSPLVAPQGEGQSPVAGVFISRQDAQTFLENLKDTNPELGNSVQVTAVSLAEVYELAIENEDQQGRIQFAFVPMEQEVTTAEGILRQNGQPNQEFNGVPLFFAESTTGQGGYLTIQQGDQRVIPVFFTQQDLQAMLDRARQQEPSLGNNIRIQVTSLEGMIQLLQSGDDPDLNSILLIPPRDSLEYIRSLRPTQGQPQQRQPQQ